MDYYKKWLLPALLLLLNNCGIPDTFDIPAAPIAIDQESSADNNLVLLTPFDDKIDRYIIWYKIYPYITQTATRALVTADYNYFTDWGVRNASDIRKKDFYELQLSADGRSYLLDIGTETTITISREPTNTANYIRVSVAGGKTYNVRRNVAMSVEDNTRRPFYGKFNLSTDVDIRGRKLSDFSGYDSLTKSFSVAFMAQSAYVDSVELSLIHSLPTQLGIIYSDEGFEDN